MINFIKSASHLKNNKKELLLSEKAYKLIQERRMANVDKKKLRQAIAEALAKPEFNLYNFLDSNWQI